jgi:hypothetical protein
MKRFQLSFGVFLVCASCTQVAPPGLLVRNGLRSSGPVPSETALLMAEESDRKTVTLRGRDAETVYRLMALQPDGDAEARKTGRDFSCFIRDSDYFCEFKIRFPDGYFNVEREEGALVRAAPEISQVAGSDGYLTISPPEKPGKVRLQILADYGARLFNALEVMDSEPLSAVQAGEQGWVKDGTQLNCIQKIGAGAGAGTAAGAVTHECYLHLDTTIGAIDKVEAHQVD